MSTRNKISALAALLSVLPLMATAGVVADKSKRQAPRPADSGGYVLRCWQDGRLILEEQHVSAPAALETGTARLQLQDRNRQPLYVAETRNATCLVRALPQARPRSARP
jgi:hypothetical protein